MKSFGSNLLAPLLLFFVFPMAIAHGLYLLTDYSARPSVETEVLQNLEYSSCLETASVIANLPPSRPTLVVVYHPKCPCTVSTLRMLQRMIPQWSEKPNIVFLAYCPKGQPNFWIESTITRIAQRIPEAKIIADPAGIHCRNFGVKTSGHTLLYDAHSQLVFEGGITPGRGHESDCPASTTLAHTIAGKIKSPTHWPVFGCPIISTGTPTQ